MLQDKLQVVRSIKKTNLNDGYQHYQVLTNTLKKPIGSTLNLKGFQDKLLTFENLQYVISYHESYGVLVLAYKLS